MQDFRFSDWDPVSGTCPAYYASEAGLIERGRVVVMDGQPCTMSGIAVRDDGHTQTLVGWGHSICQSYNEGRVLVPLKGSRL